MNSFVAVFADFILFYFLMPQSALLVDMIHFELSCCLDFFLGAQIGGLAG